LGRQTGGFVSHVAISGDPDPGKVERKRKFSGNKVTMAGDLNMVLLSKSEEND
jgi:hypothetical protein